MSVYFFGVRKEPCSDCAWLDGELLCTMNCGPSIAPPAGNKLPKMGNLFHRTKREKGNEGEQL